jgi:hypothetical protein
LKLFLPSALEDDIITSIQSMNSSNGYFVLLSLFQTVSSLIKDRIPLDFEINLVPSVKRESLIEKIKRKCCIILGRFFVFYKIDNEFTPVVTELVNILNSSIEQVNLVKYRIESDDIFDVSNIHSREYLSFF